MTKHPPDRFRRVSHLSWMNRSWHDALEALEKTLVSGRHAEKIPDTQGVWATDSDK
jgi:hypothetical protein